MEDDDKDVKFIPTTQQELSGNLRLKETRALNAINDLLNQRVTRCEQLEVSRNELLQKLQEAEALLEKKNVSIKELKTELENERNLRKDLESAAEKREEEMRNLIKTQIEKDVATKLLQERLTFTESVAQSDKKALNQSEKRLRDVKVKNQQFSKQLTALSTQADSVKAEVQKLRKERDEAVETKNKIVEDQMKILTMSKTLNDELNKMNGIQTDNKTKRPKDKDASITSTADSTSNKNQTKRGPLNFPTEADQMVKSEPTESLKVTIRQSPTRDLRTESVLARRASLSKRTRNIMRTPVSINCHRDERFTEDTWPYNHQRGSFPSKLHPNNEWEGHGYGHWENGRGRYPRKRKHDYDY